VRLRERRPCTKLTGPQELWFRSRAKHESNTDQNIQGARFTVITGENAMSEQFKKSEATKLENQKISDASAEKRVEDIAEKAAEKASKTENNYDKDHSLFSI
jgi:hypothetical protein